MTHPIVEGCLAGRTYPLLEILRLPRDLAVIVVLDRKGPVPKDVSAKNALCLVFCSFFPPPFPPPSLVLLVSNSEAKYLVRQLLDRTVVSLIREAGHAAAHDTADCLQSLPPCLVSAARLTVM